MSKRPLTVAVVLVAALLVLCIALLPGVRGPVRRLVAEHGPEGLPALVDKYLAPVRAMLQSALPPLAPPGLQPRVTVVESAPARRAIGSVSMPQGSPWCNGRPTYWLVGHDNTPETPWCLQADGRWTQPRIAVLDRTDALNSPDGRTPIDRHGCVAIDFNDDGVADLVCAIGAQEGKGVGFNEVYITAADGSLEKVTDDHGLHKYPTMRTRIVTAFDAADGGRLVFIATRGVPREDGKPNEHRLFRKGSVDRNGVPAPYFHEVDPGGPWVLEYKVSFVRAADINDDGITDLIVGDESGATRFFLQSRDGGWRALNLADMRQARADWANARVADMTGDGVADLIVVGPMLPIRREANYLRIFAGNPELPFLFDFNDPVFEYFPRFPAADVEVVDANRDGIPDLYLVQSDYVIKSDQSKGNYCDLPFQPPLWWKIGPQPPPDFVPPTDPAQDILLVGNREAERFTPLRMAFTAPGCGGLVERWNDHALIRAKGNFEQHGHNLLLEW